MSEVRQDSAQRDIARAIIFILVVVAGFLVAGFLTIMSNVGFFGPAAGKGPKAEAGYKAAAPVIEALEKWRVAKGGYPEQLAALAPDYLPDVPLGPQDRELLYERVGESYALTFRYEGPGMNSCTYAPGAEWRCSGLI
ncbi:MAG TPA: hypothetical protein VGO52_13915 [Hyphomonadaceae bacterium]|nr:hypothetical protein [Hyphomonadaceae bacterium]